MSKIFKEKTKKHKKYWGRNNEWIDTMLPLIDSHLSPNVGRAIIAFSMSRFIGHLQMGVLVDKEKNEYVPMNTLWIILHSGNWGIRKEIEKVARVFIPMNRRIMNARQDQVIGGRNKLGTQHRGNDIYKINSSRYLPQQKLDARKSGLWTPALALSEIQTTITNKKSYQNMRLGEVGYDERTQDKNTGIFGISMILGSSRKLGRCKHDNKNIQARFNSRVVKPMINKCFMMCPEQGAKKWNVDRTLRDGIEEVIESKTNEIFDIYYGRKLKFGMMDEAVDVLDAYQELTERKLEEIKNETIRSYLDGRRLRVTKLAGVFAMWGQAVEVSAKHIFEAITMEQLSSNSIKRYVKETK